jgi:hypothetical protein
VAWHDDPDLASTDARAMSLEQRPQTLPAVGSEWRLVRDRGVTGPAIRAICRKKSEDVMVRAEASGQHAIKDARPDAALRRPRTCYDHLAGPGAPMVAPASPSLEQRPQPVPAVGLRRRDVRDGVGVGLAVGTGVVGGVDERDDGGRDRGGVAGVGGRRGFRPRGRG